MAFDEEFGNNIENVYKRAVLDNMAFTGTNQEATAVNRYADNNAAHGAAINSFRQSLYTNPADESQLAWQRGVAAELEPQIAAQHNYFGGIANAQYAQSVQLKDLAQANDLAYLDRIKNDNSLRYQTDAEMEAIQQAYQDRLAAEAARRAKEQAEDESYMGMFGNNGSGDFQFTNDYKTAGRDILGWTQEDAATYGTDANAMQISGMAREMYNSGASWAETVANIDSWLASGNLPQTERAKYIAIFQAMYGPSWGQALDPVQSSRGTQATWAVDYSNMTPKEQAYTSGNTTRSPLNPLKSTKTPGGVFGRVKNAIRR
jgi:hypothetical protein